MGKITFDKNFDSKTENVYIGLPDYAYKHSSATSETGSPKFIGRKGLVNKLKNLILFSSSKTGVYLVTGNRGTGKSSLVDEVIKQTTIKKQFSHKIFYQLIILGLLLMFQLTFTAFDKMLNIDLMKDGNICWFKWILTSIAFISFCVVAYLSERRKKWREYSKNKFWWQVGYYLEGGMKSILHFNTTYNSGFRYRNVLSILFIVSTIQTVYLWLSPNNPELTQLKLFIGYLLFLYGYTFFRFTTKFTIPYAKEQWYEIKRWIWMPHFVLATAFPIIFFSRDKLFGFHYLGSFWNPVVWMLGVILVFFIIYVVIGLIGYLQSKTETNKSNFWNDFILKAIKRPINIVRDFIQNHNRIYIKINFGNNVDKESDVLRLIARTLLTEYRAFHKSWRHTFMWRALVLFVVVVVVWFGIKVKENWETRVKDKSIEIAGKKIYNKKEEIKSFVDDVLQTPWQYIISAPEYFWKNGNEKRLNKKELAQINEIKKDTTLAKNLHLKDSSLRVILKDSSELVRKSVIVDSLKTVFVNHNFAEDTLMREKKDSILVSNAKLRLQYYEEEDNSKVWYKYRNIPHAPYAFIIIFLLAYFLIKLLLRSKFFPISTHRKVLRQLEDLNMAITYNIESTQGNNVSYEGKEFKIGHNRAKRYSRLVADEREIEKELIDILNNIQDIPMIMRSPDFVFVFDELDKVQSESEQKNKTTLYSVDNTRQRQQTVLRLLANLKYFLSTAQAKFIFIAGREMYDIYLADVADRNNYLGSIFNDVIYVPSFLTDIDSNNPDICSRTEEYVCRHIISSGYPVVDYTLRSYRQYLDEVIYYEVPFQKKNAFEEEKKRLEYLQDILKSTLLKSSRKEDIIVKFLKKKTKYSEFITKILEKKKTRLEIVKRALDQIIEADLKKEKIIAVLQQFIIYLAYTSKGAPKRMAQIFEDFVESYDRSDLDEKFAVQEYRNTRFFLDFNYHEQYVIGLTAYLVAPLMYRFADTNIQRQGDKLLVSVLHFTDYLFKFHSHPFSWKNLDIQPELIEVNHSPELKQLTNELLKYYQQIHIEKPLLGLHEYRFENLISQEIAFITKINEQASALFNFSLDESLVLKSFYQNLLEKEIKLYSKDGEIPEKFVHSIFSLQVVLGDLCFFDDQLEEAALYYKDSLQKIETEKFKNNTNFAHVLIYLRTAMKLALTYEKRHQYDSAFAIYENTCQQITNIFSKTEDTTLNPEEKSYYLKAIRIMYLSFLAKFQLTEKSTPGGVNKHDILNILKENELPENKKIFENTLRWQKVTEADFNGNIADILYYKNYNLGSVEKIDVELKKLLKELSNKELSNKDEAIKNKLSTLLKKKRLEDGDKADEIRKIINKETTLAPEDRIGKSTKILKELIAEKIERQEKKSATFNKFTSCTACEYYKKALRDILLEKEKEGQPTPDEDIQKLFTTSLDYLQSYTNTVHSEANYCNVTARIVARIGNSLFSCDWEKKEEGNMCPPICKMFRKDGKNGYEIKCLWDKPQGAATIAAFFNKIEKFILSAEGSAEGLKDFINKKTDFLKIELAIISYAISAKYYTRANYHKRASFQLYKILQLLSHYKFIEGINYEKFSKAISKEAIRLIYFAYGQINLFAIQKHKLDTEKPSAKLQNILLDSEIRRVTLLVKELELQIAKQKTKEYKEYEDKYKNETDETKKSKYEKKLGKMKEKKYENALMDKLQQLYKQSIAQPYAIHYSVTARTNLLRLKAKINWTTFKWFLRDKIIVNENNNENNHNEKNYFDLLAILINKEQTNLTNIGKIIGKDIPDGEKEFSKFCLEILEDIIVDSIFCLKEVIRLCETSGVSYLFSHGYMAAAYEHLGEWVRYAESLFNIKRWVVDKKDYDKVKIEKAYKKISPDSKSISTNVELKTLLSEYKLEKKLDARFGTNWEVQLSSIYYTNRALIHYYAMLETHRGGRAYQRLIENMYFVNSDFDDCIYHFNIAIERFTIHNADNKKYNKEGNKPIPQGIDQKTKELKKICKATTLYDVDNYFEK